MVEVENKISLKLKRLRLDNDGENDKILLLGEIVGTENPADMFTKVVIADKLRLCIASVGLRH